ncbi:RidA family protein [Treponema endosymbiont of Eucomonympha sp.]|uniref:RidA family protein n=1 Tax=Treponema endosymbiont of Eucomonympha sp. TaxID=1580831 RepID=UPI0007838A8A|nr:RidA family protein [Treponema endosymbiont of Eucomonympha sp.]
MKTIATMKAPGAIGPYSQGVIAGNLVFTSGQLPINTATGALETEDIRRAARYSLENCRAVLEAAGTALGNVAKTTVFLTDMADFGAFNEVYAAFFAGAGDPPARSCVQVAALPKEAKIEIEMIAAL